VRYAPFALERWLVQAREIDLAAAGISRLRLSDVGGLDPDMLLSYGITSGSESVRERVAALYPGARPSSVLLTTGAAEANLLALYRLLEAGDELVALNPTYMQHQGLAESLGAIVKVCEVREEDRYQPDLDSVAALIGNKTKVISLVNPNNPVGQVLSADDLRTICELADRVGAWVLCDGALRGTEVSGQLAPTPVEFYPRGIATGSLTKLGMPGLRIGWLVGDEALVNDCWALKDYTTLSHSGLGEAIAVEALRPERMAAFFARARNRVREHAAIVQGVIAESNGLLSWVSPVAGHTGFPAYGVDMDSLELCRLLLAEEGVLLTPGALFNTAGHVRLRYGGDREELEEGLSRLVRFLSRQAKTRGRVALAGAAG
jgi:aspartate/methionine/tyrosine aminotransferase